jgi:hypothetical protein
MSQHLEHSLGKLADPHCAMRVRYQADFYDYHTCSVAEKTAHGMARSRCWQSQRIEVIMDTPLTAAPGTTKVHVFKLFPCSFQGLYAASGERPSY